MKNLLKVSNYQTFAAFDYTSAPVAPVYPLGSIVICAGEIGVVIQQHKSGDVRLDSIGNQWEGDMRPATMAEVKAMRPALLPFIAGRNMTDREYADVLLLHGIQCSYILGGVHITDGKGWGNVFRTFAEAAIFVLRPNFSGRNDIGGRFPKLIFPTRTEVETAY
jgi:hypothetical protein